MPLIQKVRDDSITSMLNHFDDLFFISFICYTEGVINYIHVDCILEKHI